MMRSGCLRGDFVPGENIKISSFLLIFFSFFFSFFSFIQGE